MKNKLICKLKVTLRHSRPPIWRRILVPAGIALGRLHYVLQMVVGWTDSHMHQFRVRDTFYGKPNPEFGFEVENENKVRLYEVLRQPKARMIYEYDFGDGWEHDVVLEAVVPAEPRGRYPLVLAGKGKCPPEDIGGLGGYYYFLEVMADPKHPEHHEMKEWLGEPFDPEEFDAEEINLMLHGGRRHRKPEA